MPPLKHRLRALLVTTLTTVAAFPLTAMTQSVGGSQDRSAATANPVDSAAVVDAAERLLRAISTRDTAAARRVLLPGAQLASIPDPAGTENAGRMQSDQQFLTVLTSGSQRYLERMWSPTVFVQGPLAIVRAPYDFHVDGAFSHCGVDVFTLVRSRGAWRITHVAYTTQRQGCAPSPLGAP